jgi:hypothetical protein
MTEQEIEQDRNCHYAIGGKRLARGQRKSANNEVEDFPTRN